MMSRALVTAVAASPGNGRSARQLRMFDQRPIELPGFRLKADSIEAIGKPTLDEVVHALAFAEAAEFGGPYWVGDLLNYLDTRPDFKERLSQAVGQLHMPRQTQYNLKSISKRLAPAARAIAPSRSHAEKVLALPAEEQIKWLQEARDEEWTERELCHAIRRHEKAKDITGRAETMHTVDVTVQVEVEAAAGWQAEEMAWATVKQKVTGERNLKVIAAHCRPTLGES